MAPMGSSGVSGSLTQILVPFAKILSNLELPKILAMDVTTSALVQLLSDGQALGGGCLCLGGEALHNVVKAHEGIVTKHLPKGQLVQKLLDFVCSQQ